MLADLNKVFMMYTTGHWIYSNRGSSTREAEVRLQCGMVTKVTKLGQKMMLD